MVKRYRKICFLCGYEILGTSKPRSVNYKSIKKMICKECTSSKHKACQRKYMHCNIDCSVCTKIVKGKNCIECTICNHLIHAKCNELSSNDINVLEKTSNFTCKSCFNEIFPFGIRGEITRKMKAITEKSISINNENPLLQQCFTCTNTVDSRPYKNKSIIYDSKTVQLCIGCSKKKLNLSVKNSGLIEFLECPFCHKEVKYEGIFCNSCQSWAHPSCCGMTARQLKEITDSSKVWNCHCCTKQNISNSNKTELDRLYETFTDCSICSKRVKSNQSICCTLCKHWVHSRCLKIYQNSDFKVFNENYKNTDWFCTKCMEDTLPCISMDDDDFQLFCFENQQVYLNTSEVKSKCKQLLKTDMFNKHIFTESSDKIINNEHTENDPDRHFTDKDNCNFIFNLSDIKTKESDFTVLTFNIRSIRNKFEQFTTHLLGLDQLPDIISLTETWLLDSDNLLDYQIENYHKPILCNRQKSSSCSKGGGILTYIRKNITNYSINKRLSFNNITDQCQVINFLLDKKKRTFVNCYRSPKGDANLFLKKLDNVLKNVTRNTCIVAGDFNFNLLNMTLHKTTEEYYNIMLTNSFKPLITKPTRVTDSTQTLIDHIWTNDLRTNTDIQSFIYVTDLSDHLPCISKFGAKHFRKENQYKTYRQITDENKLKFRKNITKSQDVLLFHCNNPHVTVQQRFTDFFEHLTRIYNECFPVKRKKVSWKRLEKPWITDAIMKKIEKRNKLFSQKSVSESAKIKYKTIKKEIEKDLELARTSYFRSKLENGSESIKSKWDTIRLMINRKDDTNTKLPISNEILGNHYSTIAEKLADDIPGCSQNMTNKNPKYKNKFNLNFTTPDEVYEKILQLDKNKGAGVDCLDISSTKYIADIIKTHLCALFNESIRSSEYPNIFKIAKCTPIFKGTGLDPCSAISYRPISILNGLNKVYEKIIHDQIYKFVEKDKALPFFQYGFRKKHNTSQAILHLLNLLEKNKSEKKVSLAIFMDLSKAFDTVNKNILINKLINIGFDETSSKLIDSYMTDRKFCLTEDLTKYYNLTHGVPQGSILGPLLFILYTHDIINISKNDTTVYADDTTLVVSGRTLQEATDKANLLLKKFVHYFNINKLSVNPTKTKYIVYYPNQKILKSKYSTNLLMDEKILEEVKVIKYLGVIINNKLTWNDHKLYIKRKIAQSIGILYNCKKIFDEKQEIDMYKTFIETHLLYAIEAWGHSIHSESDILQKIQNKVLRILFDCKRSEDAWRHANGRILTVDELYKKSIVRLCTKHHFNILPTYFSNEIMPKIRRSISHNHNLRSNESTKHNYLQKRPSEHLTELQNQCILTWNKLPAGQKDKPYKNSEQNVIKEENGYLHNDGRFNEPNFFKLRFFNHNNITTQFF